MKKIIKSRIFLVIITMIIVASVSVYAATTYKATDVVYNASDGISMNVNDALNELYSKSNNTGYPDITMYLDSGYVAASNCSDSITIDIPDGYNYLTVTINYPSIDTIKMDGTIITSGEKYNVSEKEKVLISVSQINTGGTYVRAMGTIVLTR